MAVAAWASASADAERLTSRVDPFIGTGGHGHTYPGPSLPFGMIQPGPDTRLAGWDGCSGYHASDTRIFGFSHTHLSGTGIPDYGDVLLMPITGERRFRNGSDGAPGYASSFRHETEEAKPGFYAVTLDDAGVRVELTTARRAALHRYTFPKGRPAHVVLDLTHRDEVLESRLRFVGDREIEGMRRSRGWARNQVVHFVIRFSRPVRESLLAVDGVPRPGLRAAAGLDLRSVASFGSDGGPLLVKVGISAVDVDGARRNLDAELPGWNFDAVKRAADEAWEDELGRIRVEGGTARQRTIFYSALYHAFLAPNLYGDVDGRYRGRDQQIHRAEGFEYHTVFSLWDTFRALHPLLTIVDRRRTTDFVKTFLRQYQEGGRLPVWELAANETDCMIGYPAVPVIADAMLKGIGGFDEELALEAMIASADGNRAGLEAYRRDGFISAEREAESVSKTLEYAYEDWCIARVALKLGRTEDARRFLGRAQAFEHLFDPSTGFMRAREEGHWVSPFDPAEVNAHYTEATAWQYAFFVPHDIDGLMKLHGGRDAFARKLDALFAADSRLAGNQQEDITGLVGQYAHGNEPSHHMAYLWAFAGQAWKTQAMVRRLIDEMYTDRPDGLAGNEDCGQMSAWYVLSALGFYPVAPGSNQYVVGAPLFRKATIRLENGRRFVIRALGVSSKAIYIQSARLGDVPYTRSFVDHAVIEAGGELVFEMGEKPRTGWGSGPGDAPRTSLPEPHVLPAPFVASGDLLFHGATRIELADADPAAEIRFTTDGSEPTSASSRYTSPVPITGESVIRAAAFAPGALASPPVEIHFHPMPEGRTVTLDAAYSRQYGASGSQALVDGLRGGSDFRRGRWQGYQGKDLTAVVDLGREQAVHRLAMGFLQDTGSWILMPRSVAFAVSADGVVWRDLGAVSGDVPDREKKAVTRDFALDVTGARARYVRAKVASYGPLPVWHPGAGEPSFFFVDEIVVE